MLFRKGTKKVPLWYKEMLIDPLAFIRRVSFHFVRREAFIPFVETNR